MPPLSPLPRSGRAAAARQFAAGLGLVAVAASSCCRILGVREATAFSLSSPRFPAPVDKERVDAPTPWDMDAVGRLQKHLKHMNSPTGGLQKPVRFWDVLDAGQYLAPGQVIAVLTSLRKRADRIDNPTDWVVRNLHGHTRMKLSRFEIDETGIEKIKRTIGWINLECEFKLPIAFNDIHPTIYNTDYAVVQKLLQRVHEMVKKGNQEVQADPSRFIIFWITRWKQDYYQLRKWVDWQNEHGDLQQQLDWSSLKYIWKLYDRRAFWAIIKENEDALAEKEDPMNYLRAKLQLPAAISQVSRDHFRNMVDVKAVEQAAEGMILDSVVRCLEDAVRRRWEIDDNEDPTYFILAVLREEREEGGDGDKEDSLNF